MPTAAVVADWLGGWGTKPITRLGEVDPSTNRLLIARLKQVMDRHKEEELLLTLIEV